MTTEPTATVRAPRSRSRRTDQTPAAAALPADLDALLRRMRFPYLRAAAPDVLATARAQRWDPAEVLRVLLAEELPDTGVGIALERVLAAPLITGITYGTRASTVLKVGADGAAWLEERSRTADGSVGNVATHRFTVALPAAVR